MLKLYSRRSVQRRLARLAHPIDLAAGRSGVPAACIRAVLMQEMGDIDLMDPVADLAVRFYWLRWRLRGGRTPRLLRGALGKKDSSTGCGQIFAYVAIRALNFAAGRGLPAYDWLGLSEERPLRPDRDEDLQWMWYRLHRDPEANILLSALNLLSAAEEMTGRRDFKSFSPEQLQLTFTRYNANVRHVTAYGQKVFALYLQEKTPENV
ncbi:MAG: hypothetical protein IJ179_05415 [Oscillospiraceae bacterium]|nr:hypothetical protein [Oscillospiraceae bacterium]